MPVSAPTRMTLPKLPRREQAMPRSQAERLWLISGGIIAFVILLIGYFFFISPQRSNTGEVKAQIAAANQQNTVLQGRINALREQSKNMAKYEADLAKARLALPSESGVSDFLRTLQALGNATMTDVTSLTVGEPAPLTVAAAAHPTAAANPTATATAGTVRPTTVAAAPTMYQLPLSASVMGTTNALEKFLDQLQAVQPRAVLITQVSENSVGSGEGAGKSTLQLTMQAFVAPGTPSAASAAPSATASG